MVTSHNNGNEIIFNDGEWIYQDGTPVNNAWNGRCSGNGNRTYIDKDGNRRYFDNDELCSESKPRSCGKCGRYPTSVGDDFCLQHLGNVMNACCGHGSSEGYIQFDNGITIRGYFRIVNDNDGSVIDNTIGTEIFKCKFCGQIYNASDGRTRCGACGNDMRNVVGEVSDFGVEYISTKVSNTEE